MQKLLTRYKNAHEAALNAAETHDPNDWPKLISESAEARMQLIRALDAPYDISHDALVERAMRRISAEAPPISELDDYSDMKPLHVSPLTWAVAIIGFIIMWGFAIYGGYCMFMEWIL